ncbi:hypothetical protein QVD17_33801 [Tagetes erecta]|uniref:Uncharacterized protein n=1 Tax=Tagetes erecta TaxID=13708 RepID=A0AAD8JYR8_TARER|nr:hypothetical protein QVD17_33801 [Tagetes erecta]
MGNFTSCFSSNPQSATLIHVNGNIQIIKLPITAAEIMLIEQPGHLLSPVIDDLRSNFRLSALRADEVLVNGKLYFFIPVGRLNTFVTESELEMLRLDCGNVKRMKRCRKSKVSPEEEKNGGDMVVSGDGGFTGCRVGGSPVWKPVLETIFE